MPNGLFNPSGREWRQGSYRDDHCRGNAVPHICTTDVFPIYASMLKILTTSMVSWSSDTSFSYNNTMSRIVPARATAVACCDHEALEREFRHSARINSTTGIEVKKTLGTGHKNIVNLPQATGCERTPCTVI